jgi:tetratricopeptide (TPR) repeat protein
MAYAQCSRAFGEAYANIREGIMERLAEARRLLARIDYPDMDLFGLCSLAESTFQLRSGNGVAAEQILRDAKRVIEQNDATDHRIYASVLSALTGIYMSRNQPREALRWAQLVGAIHDRDGRGGTADRLISRQNEASALQAMGESQAALAVRETVNRRLMELGDADEAPPLTWVNYALVLLRLERHAEALNELDRVLDRVRATGSPYVLASALLARGAALVELKRWDEADSALREAASLAASGITDRRAGALIEAWMARADLLRGNLASAHRHGDESLELAGYHSPKPERSLPTVLLEVSEIAFAEGAQAKAEQYARDALGIFEPMARGPDTSADVGEALLRLAHARRALEPHADTRPMLERAVRCLSNGLGPKHSLTIEARTLLLSSASAQR